MTSITSLVQSAATTVGLMEEESYIIERLNELAVYENELAALSLVTNMMIQDITPEDLAQSIADIKEEMAPKELVLTKKIAQLREDIKPKLLKHGETVKGPGFTASYSPGRRVDPAKVMELADKYPAIEEEVLACFVSKPSVRFVKNNRGR